MSAGLIPRPVVTAIAAVVIAVWALAQAAEIFVPTYDAPAEIHLTVMAVLGALFGLRKDDRGRDQDDDEDDNDREDRGGGAGPPAAPAARADPETIVLAADLIARLQQERERRERG